MLMFLVENTNMFVLVLNLFLNGMTLKFTETTSVRPICLNGFQNTKQITYFF